jgi:hypothetical protein
VKIIPKNMIKMEFSGGKKRMLAYEKLKFFLSNPGMFCVVVVGSRGFIRKTFCH